jgi:hypothetical protein
MGFQEEKEMKTLLLLIVSSLVLISGCSQPVTSASGTKMKIVSNLKTDQNGNTVEQNNISDKIQIEADAEKTWHLYVVSPYDRQLILHSTVIGKITSSNKRLTPSSVTDVNGKGMTFEINGHSFFTSEMPSEDGTFGSSAEYIYWKDNKGRNHRHFMLGGQIIHVVDQPMTMSELSGDE